MSYLFCIQLSGSWSPGDALRHWKDSVPVGPDCGLSAGEWPPECLGWSREGTGWSWAETSCRPQAYPLEVTKLIYCSRTVPEIEKVGSADRIHALPPPLGLGGPQLLPLVAWWAGTHACPEVPT